MKILAIGNSFSQDATRYLHQIARCDNVDLTVVNLYIGGCSLERHYNNILKNEKAYEYELNGRRTSDLVSIRHALESDKWDVVTMQQVSHSSVNYDSYNPYIKHLSDYIKKYAPQAAQIIHQTWAYEQGSQRLNVELGYKDQYDMFSDLKKSYSQVAEDLGGLRIIPSGEAFQYAIKSGITNLHRDTFHASLGLGRYILGAVWYETLTGNSIENNTFIDFDEPVDENIIKNAKKCVSEAVKNHINL